MNNINGPLKVGIGGGIGTGKTSLTEALCRYYLKKSLWQLFQMIFIQLKMPNI